MQVRTPHGRDDDWRQGKNDGTTSHCFVLAAVINLGLNQWKFDRRSRHFSRRDHVVKRA